MAPRSDCNQPRFTLNDLRAARASGKKVAMLTCYDYTTARLMQQAGVPMLLVGDSAANIVLGHPTTLPISLALLIELTAAVRRGAPNALLFADMPFGSYQGSLDRGLRNVFRMVKRSGCDCVKIEASENELPLIQSLAGAGVAVMAHLGLRPQTVGLVGGYKFQGRTAASAAEIVETSKRMAQAGAAALLLEAVPPEVSRVVVGQVAIPVIGCGAGSDCDGSVIVTQDAMNMTPSKPRFVPEVADLATPAINAYADYVQRVATRTYPAPQHQYEMDPAERAAFLKRFES